MQKLFELSKKERKFVIGLMHWLRSSDAYIEKTPPKSTGRERYAEDFLNEITAAFPHILPNDLMRAIVPICLRSPEPPEKLS